MTVKTARITVLGTPTFKSFLEAEAEKEGVSVSELVRRRCEPAPSDEERLLADLTAQLQQAVTEAQDSLRSGIAAVNDALKEIHSKHGAESQT